MYIIVQPTLVSCLSLSHGVETHCIALHPQPAVGADMTRLAKKDLILGALTPASLLPPGDLLHASQVFIGIQPLTSRTMLSSNMSVHPSFLKKSCQI